MEGENRVNRLRHRDMREGQLLEIYTSTLTFVLTTVPTSGFTATSTHRHTALPQLPPTTTPITQSTSKHTRSIVSDANSPDGSSPL